MTAVVGVTVSPGAPQVSVPDAAPAAVTVRVLQVVSVSLDAALDVATAASERTPTFLLRVDWIGNGSYSHPWSDMTRMIEKFTMTEELGTDLPATIGWVEGTSATKLQFTVGGRLTANGYLHNDGSPARETDAVYAFSPYGASGPGPLLGAEVQLYTGFQTEYGPVSLLQFTGKLANYSPSAASREVEINALDPVTTLHQPITIYAYGIDGILLQRYGGAAYPWAVNNQWFIDRILRNCGYYASPPVGGVGGKNLCTLSVTMHGSNQHEIGSVTYPLTGYYAQFVGNTTYANPYEWGTPSLPVGTGTHPYNMMFPRWGYDYTIKWLCRSPGLYRPGIDGWGMSGLIYLPESNHVFNTDVWSFQPTDRALDSSSQLVMQLKIITNVPCAFISWPGGHNRVFVPSNYVPPQAAGWTYVGIHFRSQTNGTTITMNIGGVVGSVFDPTVMPSNVAYEPMALAFGRVFCPFTNFSIWYQPNLPTANDWVGQTWNPTASIEPSMNWVGGNEDILNTDSYDLLKEIVAAEFGTFYFDEYKVPHFRSRIIDHGLARAPETVTSDRHLSDLVVTVDDSQVRNSIDYEADVSACGPWEKIWEPDDPNYLTINQGETKTWNLPVPGNCPIIAETDSQAVQWVTSELWDNIEDNPYYADKVVFAASALSDPTLDAWEAISTGRLPRGGGYFTFRLRRLDQRTALLTVFNNIGFGVRFATPVKIGTQSGSGVADTNQVTEGKPAFRMCGRPLIQYPEVAGTVRHDVSVARYGLRTYDLGGKSPWRQSCGAGPSLASSLLQWTALPKPVLSDVETPHNPRRRLGDKIILSEPDSFGARIWCTLAARSVEFGPDGARDSLTLRPDSPPPGW